MTKNSGFAGLGAGAGGELGFGLAGSALAVGDGGGAAGGGGMLRDVGFPESAKPTNLADGRQIPVSPLQNNSRVRRGDGDSAISVRRTDQTVRRRRTRSQRPRTGPARAMDAGSGEFTRSRLTKEPAVALSQHPLPPNDS